MADDAGILRSLPMRDGAELYCRRWAVVAPRGVVVAVHGIQSHSGWYLGTGAALAAAGYDVTFVDRRGSGANRMQRGDAPARDLLLDDLGEFVDDARRRRPGRPVHLAAISWGAKLAVAACIRRPGLVDSLALVNPGLASRVDVSFADKCRTALALATRPTRAFDVPLSDARLFTDNPERVAFIENDALLLRRVTARFLYETRRLDRLIERRAAELRAPALMLLAGRDRIVDNARTKAIFERFASQPKEMIVYPDAAHTLEFERDPGPMRRDLVKWLNERSASSG